MIAALTVLAAASASAGGCMPVEGANRLWPLSVRWVIVGETHGTNEAPRAFANLVCLASATRRPVTAAIEYPSEQQPRIDTFLRSDGKSRARAEFLKLPVFTAEMQDGRGSVAFVRLLEQLREMKRANRISGVVAFDVSASTSTGQDRNAVMAQNWRAISAPDDGVILALVGNIHAIRKPVTFGSRTIVPAASMMPADRTVTLNIVGAGGKAWLCQREGCGERDVGLPRTGVTGISYVTDPESRWGAIYDLGVPTTAAPPAVRQGQASPNTAR